MHVIAGKAVAFGEALQPSFRVYCAQVLANARVMGERLLARGVSLVSGGTDNHLLLLDFSQRDFSGKEAEEALGRAGITVNKNTVPNETRSPFVTSGVRIGTPAITTRGLVEADCVRVADLIVDALENRKDADRLAAIRAEVHALTSRFPVPGL
jgi:glycine hydroxymethyltransferase